MHHPAFYRTHIKSQGVFERISEMERFKFIYLFIFFFILSGCGGGDDEPEPTQETYLTVQSTPNNQVIIPANEPVLPNQNTAQQETPVVAITEPVTTVPTQPAVVINTPTQSTPINNNTCLPGVGKDYLVGPNQPYPTINDVPWENIAAGDTVRITYNATPYKSKFIVAGFGNQNAPIVICGIPGPNGEKPIIEGNGATTRLQLNTTYGNSEETFIARSDRSIIEITKPSYGTWDSYPSYIVVKGLHLRNFNNGDSFTDARGLQRKAAQFNACIWIDRGQNIEISDNVIDNCSMGIFTKSTNDGNFSVTTNLVIKNNTFSNQGVIGSDREHSAYTSGVNILYEFNIFYPPKPGALGNALKDRSAGLVVRYNEINEGAHSIDMVEAEDFPSIALALPQYRKTFIYGNIINKTGDSGSAFHYGGDHFGAPPGANWGETLLRQGVLYFWNNTVTLTGTTARIFQISTTLERVEAWNNIFYSTVPENQLYLRQNENDIVSANYVRGGVLNFGVNWIRSDYADSDIYHPITGSVLGLNNLITGNTKPFSNQTYKPDQQVIDKCQSNLKEVSDLTLSFQFNNGVTSPRIQTGNACDLGAIEL